MVNIGVSAGRPVPVYDTWLRWRSFTHFALFEACLSGGYDLKSGGRG